MKMTAEPMVPKRSATSGLRSANMRTDRMPRSEQISPVEARTSGMNCRTDRSPPRLSTEAIDIDAASAIEAIIEPQ